MSTTDMYRMSRRTSGFRVQGGELTSKVLSYKHMILG